MKVSVVLLLVASLLMLTGCEGDASSDKSETDSSSFSDELTSIGEIPSVLEESLSPEEKAKLKEQILPSGSGNGTTPEERFKVMFENAQLGDAKAQNGLGVMYYTGEAISKNAAGKVLDNDPELAAGWFYRSAEQGYADAQFNLGLMYVNGDGVEKDIAQAVELFQKAAEQGHVDAQNNLGALYYMGEGVPKDLDKAIQWFEKAAAQGNTDAQVNLNAIRSQQ
tara:strand:+ start:1518 stop:2186 length:669 start_codon:yes stop_codon:yes gene_type:complete